MQPALVSLDRDRNRHMQDTPFIYLHIIGVATIHQGKGYGRLLLQALIEKSEKAGLPIYLETETARNAEMYQRFGFNTVNEIILPIINLPMWEMIRKPIQ